MSVYEHWEACKPALRAQLEASDSLSDAAYAVRHALMQVEQNALAAMDDGVLRQQAGVLLGLVKGDCALLTAQASSQVWVPQRHGDKPSRRGLGLWSAPVLVLLALAGYCFLKGLTLGWIAALAALATGAWALLRGMRRPQEAGDEIRVTLHADASRLLPVLDAQIEAVDRSLEDLSCLNSQLRGGTEKSDAATLSRAADLMEALCGCDPEAREAAGRLLAELGLGALDYSEENRRLFNALPSKTETRTLAPAIVSLEDQRLLRRGTAAVRTGAA